MFSRAFRQRPYSTGGLTWDNWEIATVSRDGSAPHVRTSHKYYRAASPRFAANDSQVVYSVIDTAPIPILMRLSLQSNESAVSLLPTVTSKACGSRGSDLQLSRDQQEMTFISDGQECYSYDVYVMDHASTDAKALGVTQVSTYNENPVFVPGTEQIFYLAGTQEAGGGRSRYSLYSVDRDGSNAHEIADPKLFDDPLHWRSK